MDFTFTDEQKMLREMVKKFADKELRPLAAQIDREHQIPKELYQKAAELGFFGIPFPEQYGGAGMGEIGYCIMLEELTRAEGSFPVSLGGHVSIGAMAIYINGSEEQKKKYLVPLAQGKLMAAFALTEPNAGSDAGAVETAAVLDGNEYVLNGSKCYITNGGIADIFTVFAATQRGLGPYGGITAFIVERGFKGFKQGREEEKMGIRGTSTTELFFENMRVPKENVIGEVGMGFMTAMKTLDVGRVSLAAGCVGAAKELVDACTRYAKQRVQFGKPIAEQEGIQFVLAEMAAKTYAMESMTYRTAWLADQNMRYSRESAICKYLASEWLDWIVDQAVQIHGGLGYMADYPIERAYRDARINRIFEGTNEIQRLIIARDLLKRGRY